MQACTGVEALVRCVFSCMLDIRNFVLLFRALANCADPKRSKLLSDYYIDLKAY